MCIEECRWYFFFFFFSESLRRLRCMKTHSRPQFKLKLVPRTPPPPCIQGAWCPVLPGISELRAKVVPNSRISPNRSSCSPTSFVPLTFVPCNEPRSRMHSFRSSDRQCPSTKALINFEVGSIFFDTYVKPCDVPNHPQKNHPTLRGLTLSFLVCLALY